MNPDTDAKETLFDLHQFSKKGTCKNCGKEFRFHKWQLFCCPKCKRAFFNRKTEKTLHDRFQITQHFDLPSPELCPRDVEAVELYKRNIGIKSIARSQGRAHTVVRRGLIKAGIYRPETKHNGTAKIGTGAGSRILKKRRMEQQEKEWRHKMAVCLWHLRRGRGVESTCHSYGWSRSGIWNHLHKNKTYGKWKTGHPAKAESVLSIEYDRNGQRRSKKYPNEQEFQAVINEFLTELKLEFIREKKLLRSKNRVDFLLIGSIYLECKVCTRSGAFARAIGQAFLYKAEAKEVWIVVPDDVSIRKDHLDILEKQGVQVFSETILREKLSGIETLGCVQSTNTSVPRIVQEVAASIP